MTETYTKYGDTYKVFRSEEGYVFIQHPTSEALILPEFAVLPADIDKLNIPKYINRYYLWQRCRSASEMTANLLQTQMKDTPVLKIIEDVFNHYLEIINQTIECPGVKTWRQLLASFTQGNDDINYLRGNCGDYTADQLKVIQNDLIDYLERLTDDWEKIALDKQNKAIATLTK